MKFLTPITLSMIGLLSLSACVNPDSYSDNPNARAQNGAVIGGMTGALIGATSNSSHRLGATILGGAVGAMAGGAIGTSLDKQAAELRSSLSNSQISVTNMGSYLLVNMPQDVLFATDSASLRPDLSRDIQAVASNLLKYPNSTIEVTGHTDNTGSAAHNLDLSRRRAGSVASVLTASGVPSYRVTTIGRGEDAPVASNLSAEGRAQNRRVEIIIRPNQQ
jgi:outer membrane protein OmpA-like peptidoglycan-associated protein